MSFISHRLVKCVVVAGGFVSGYAYCLYDQSLMATCALLLCVIIVVVSGERRTQLAVATVHSVALGLMTSALLIVMSDVLQQLR